MSNLKKQRDQLQKNADDIAAARTLADTTGTVEVARFGAAIGKLSTIWQTAKNDAQSIVTWLGKMEKDVSITYNGRTGNVLLTCPFPKQIDHSANSRR